MNVVKVMAGLIVAVVFGLAGCGGGGSGDSAPNTAQPVQKTSAIDGSWENVTGAQVDTGNFYLYGNVRFSNGNISTSGSLGTTSGSYFNRDGTFSLNGNTLAYTLTSSNSGYYDTSQSIADILNHPPSGSTSTINQSITCTATLSGDILVLKDSSGNTIMFKKSGSVGMSNIPFVKAVAVTPSKIPNPFSATTTSTPLQISITILDSGADIDHVTIDFYSDGSGIKDVNNPSATISVASQASTLTQATVVIPYTVTTLPMTATAIWTHLIKVTAFDKAGNKSNTEQIYMWTL